MVNMGFGCVIPVLPLFAAQMGMGAMGVGMILSAPSVSRVMLNMPFGEATDRFGRKPLMLAGQLTTALASVATGRLK
jgi:MFS transporter, DHA1 family, multidrug resistance protein